MRGKVDDVPGGVLHRGITPAYAGKSRSPRSASALRWDHPRICGEKRLMLLVFRAVTGSPPRMRGKVSHLSIGAHLKGITPAYAGKSQSPEYRCPSQGDHPRVCGEKARTLIVQDEPQGLPPRMRGKVSGQKLWMVLCGITPAYAGKRVSRSPAKTGAWNHPRVCGEKAFGCRRCTFPQGSPPRMRGKVAPMRPRIAPPGITPACAGKSARRQAGPPGPAPPPQMRSGWSPPLCTGRQCRTRKSTHARRARIPAPAHTPAPQ